MTIRSRALGALQRLIAPPWEPANGRPRAYFVYAKAKSAEVDGKLTYPITDVVVQADDSAKVQYYQIGELRDPALVPSDPLPYRVTVADLACAILSLDRQALTEHSFIRLIHRRLPRQLLPWRVRWLWDLRTLLIARSMAGRLSRIAAAHDVAYISDFYSAVMFGITLAFRRAGKPVWDIQHGRIGPGHQAYNAEVFAIDCGLRPTGLVVWDARVGAYVAEALHVQWVSTDYAHLKQSRFGAATSAGDILYTLQVDTPIPPEVIALVREDRRLHWRFRRHPGGRNPERDLLPLLELSNVTLSAPRTPLEKDLLSCAIHVTVNSSVVSEAAVLGVRSVLLDPAAEQDFALEVGNGAAEVVAPAKLGAVLSGILQLPQSA